MSTKILDAQALNTQARLLATALAGQGIGVKHTRALDLLAAVYGQSHRYGAKEGLKRPDVPNRALLANAVEPMAQFDLGRRTAIQNAVLAVAYPAEAARKLELELSGLYGGGNHAIEASVTAADLADPETFLAGGAGQAVLKSLAGMASFERWSDYSNSGPMSLRDGNEAAAIIQEAYESGWTPEGRLATAWGEGNDPQRYIAEDMDDQLDEVVEALEEAAEELGVDEFDTESWKEAVTDALAGVISDQDTTSPLDLLGDQDQCEILFVFHHPDLSWDDCPITSIEPWSVPDTIRPDEHLAHALASLGHDLDSFQARFGQPIKTPQYGRPFEGPRAVNVPARRAPLLTMDQVAEVIENVGSRNFVFVVYGKVPLKQLAEMPFEYQTRPIALTGATVGAYVPWGGAFYDVSPALPRIELAPEEGRLTIIGNGHSPDAMNGYIGSHARAKLEVLPAPEAVPETVPGGNASP